MGHLKCKGMNNGGALYMVVKFSQFPPQRFFSGSPAEYTVETNQERCYIHK